ncbi:MAG TPA: hypothetical protein VLA09_06225 [Longimicrobiales bacterium]|nr:hypothetical protein [Longimicrobiales bacterium]
MTSSAPHWHLILNHFPTVGTVIGLGLLLGALYLKSEDLELAALGLLVVLGLVAIPTYISGAAAAWALQEEVSARAELVTAHEDAALFAFASVLCTGWLAWLTLWLRRRFSRAPRWSVLSVAALAAVSLLLMVRAGTLGGGINHPEIVTGETVAGPGHTAAMAAWVVDGAVTWPSLEATHFIGMSMLFGVVLLMVLRVFGVGRGVPFSALHRLLPLGIFGFMMNVGSGMLFFIADSDRYSAMTAGFFPKLALIVIGGVGLLYFTLVDETWSLGDGDDAPMRAKVVAAAILLLWSGVIVYGRLLPYLEGL